MEKDKYTGRLENGAYGVDRKKASAPNPDTDDFWDISDLVPISVRENTKRNAKTIASLALSEIDIPGEELCVESIPSRTENAFEKKPVSPVIEYDGDGAVSHVRIMPWHTRFSFYDPFAERAEHFWSKKYKKCDHVSFFSYMPQYDQMSREQFLYYLYWRDRTRHGEYLMTDFSYILLYLYEIINLSDRINTTLGARLIALVWAAYRETYPYLDKYAGEWLCDYCLIHRVPVPHDELAPIMPDAARAVSIGEMLLPIGDNADSELVFSCSNYNYKKSKYYSVSKKTYDEHMKNGVLAGAMAYLGGDIYNGTSHIRVVRDSFSGAIASFDVKFKIEIDYRCALRSQRTKEVSTGIIKLCENNIRAYLGIKSRFSRINIPKDVENAVTAYFDKALPDRFQKAKRDVQSEDYMHLYEPEQVGIADISRAMQIENDAWQTAIELDSANLECDEEMTAHSGDPPPAFTVLDSPNMTAEPLFSTNGGDMVQLISELSKELKEVLAEAVSGSFKAACTKRKLIPSDAERRINEAAYDIIGDAVMSEGDIIEDYRDDIIAAIT